MVKEPEQERKNWVSQGNEAPLSGEQRLAEVRVWSKGVYTVDLEVKL